MKKTGFVAIVGRANVGKSTLLNALTGEKIAIVSKKPQTTRNRITGILSKGENQFVFVDTPGVLHSKNKLGDYMMKTVSSTLGGVDAAILVVDADYLPGEIEKRILSRFEKDRMPALLAVNKIDKSTPIKVAECIKAYAELYNFSSVIPVSALKNDGVDIVLEETERFLHEGEWLFEEDAMTEQPERQIAAEFIREKILRLMDDEIPHGTAVVIEEFKEKKDLISIRAEIFCEREAHKRILIGKNGEMLKKIGSYAREDLEKFFGIQVYLNLWVKVKENWRDSDFLVANFGYDKKDLDQ
ncbi:MAG: GTPase Era [Clostridiales bacterium]|nr:GTPase Era [Clostridiales bacterium]HCH67499.1 GTPase Era [Clostridiales bacterium]